MAESEGNPSLKRKINSEVDFEVYGFGYNGFKQRGGHIFEGDQEPPENSSYCISKSSLLYPLALSVPRVSSIVASSSSTVFVKVQYLAYIYHFVKEWRKNPKWSLSCCLALLLPLNQLQGEIRRLTGTNILKQQLQTGKIQMPTIANTLRESGVVDVTLEDHSAEREQEEATTDEKTIEQGVLTIAKVICGTTLRETGAVDIALEDHSAEREQEEATTDEKTIEQGVLSIVEVVIHQPPREICDTKFLLGPVI